MRALRVSTLSHAGGSGRIGVAGRVGEISRLQPSWTCCRCLTNHMASSSSSSSLLPRQHQYQLRRNLHSSPRNATSPTAINIPNSPNVNTTSTTNVWRNTTNILRRRRKLVLGILAGTVVLGGLGYGWEDLKHTAFATQRAGRVAIALAACINDYRVTLKALENEPDPQKQQTMLEKCHKRCADRTYKVLEKNGSIFIKLGQHLAAMGYLLPKEWTTTFIPLQDKCPVSSFESIKEMVYKDTGHTIEELFDEFDPVPLGAASLAQVHRAKVKGTGEEVAVKVQHPSLAEWIPLDIALTRFTFTNIKYFFPHYPLRWLSDEIEASLPQELNFEREAQNIALVRDHFSNLPKSTYPLVVPTVIWAKPRILVMSYLPGRRLDDLEWLRAEGIDPGDVSAALAHVFNEMIFGRDAPLHCDPHAGNLAIRKTKDGRKGGFEIILYDHGLYRTIPERLRRSYARMWVKVLEGDIDGLRKYAGEVVNYRDPATHGTGSDGEEDLSGWTEQRFRIFASAITGREFRVLTSPGGVAKETRGEAERKVMSSALSPIHAQTPPLSDGLESAGEGETEGGMLAQLMQLLANVPRVVLLILKTNDLTRSLDEMLMRGSGESATPERGFLILARYCARTVFEEEIELALEEGGGRWTLNGWIRWLKAVWGLCRVEVRLRVFEALLGVRRKLGLQSGFPMGKGGAMAAVGTGVEKKKRHEKNEGRIMRELREMKGREMERGEAKGMGVGLAEGVRGVSGVLVTAAV